MRRLAWLAPLALVGCGSGPQAYFPLKEGAAWTYQVRGDQTTRILRLRVAGRTPVDATLGYELGSATGPCRVAWRGGTLIVRSLPGGVRFEPALPMLVGDEAHASRAWVGDFTFGATTIRASAEVDQAPEKYRWLGRDVPTLRSSIRLETDKGVIELVTWFQKGVGILRQEQRADGALIRSLERIEGP